MITLRWIKLFFQNVHIRKKVGGRSPKTLAKGLLVVIFTFSCVLGYYSTRLSFDFDFEKFFPTSDRDAAFYERFRTQFRSDNDFLLLVVEHDRSVFDMDFLRRLDQLTQRLGTVPSVERVQSITNLPEIRFYDFGIVQRIPYFSKRADLLASDSTRLFRRREWVETFVSRDARSVCLFIKHRDGLPTEEGQQLVEEIQRRTAKLFPSDTRLAGRVIGQVFYIEKMANEMFLFVSISMLLVTAFLYVTFRTFWGVALPLLVLTVSLVWVVGLMGLFHIPINLILVILPPIMFVVAMSDVIHLVSHFLDKIRSGTSKEGALISTAREIGMSTFLTSLTTAIGFFSLLFVRVQPIQIFGLVMGIGVMVAFVVTWMMLPALIYVLPLPKRTFVPRKWNWSTWLSRRIAWIIRFKKQILRWNLAFLILTVIGAFGLRSNNYLMDDLRDDEPIKADFNFVDRNFGGVRPFELAVTLRRPESSMWDPEVLQELEKVEQYLTQTYGVRVKVSLVQAVKSMRRSLKQGTPSAFQLPESPGELRKIRRFLSLAEGGTVLDLLLDSTQRMTRINGTIPDWGNLRVTEKNRAFSTFVDRSVRNDLIDVRMTGSAYLLDKNMRYLSASLVQGIALSVAVISLIMALLYSDWRIVLISLIPNLIPLFLLASLMGLLGIELKITTAIVFTIAFGIAVDDTIHFLSRFKLELRAGHSTEQAVRNAFVHTGKAMILTTLILCSGFLMLLLSSFMGTFALGLMICITLFVALLLDLTLLPALLLRYYRS